jgi:multidrug resistance protein, MATE family
MTTELTKYKRGSVKELWTLAYPMILAFLSGNLMQFADRLFLAGYSVQALNAAAAAGIVASIFQYGTATIASIAEVFVGQFNGAEKFKKVAAPVWQMLWFSLFMCAFFGAIAKWGGPYLLSHYHYSDHGLPYFQWLLYFGAATPAIAALSSFFVGIGKTRRVMVITILGNLLNVALDPLLIFGVSGWIAPMGTKGAAIATGVSTAAQMIAFAWMFLGHKYREKYATGVWRLDLSLFTRCLKVGVPGAIGHMIEWAAWAMTLRIMATTGELYLTVATIGQSMYMLLAFAFNGMEKAITTLAANRIGEGCPGEIWRVWRSGVKLLFISAVPAAILMLGYPDLIITQFFSAEVAGMDAGALVLLLQITAAGVFLYYILDGFTWISVGVLTAAEDTWFVMWTNAITAWLCGLLPIGIAMAYLKLSPGWYFFIMCFYGLTNALVFYRRLKKSPWTHKESLSKA